MITVKVSKEELQKLKELIYPTAIKMVEYWGRLEDKEKHVIKYSLGNICVFFPELLGSILDSGVNRAQFACNLRDIVLANPSTLDKLEENKYLNDLSPWCQETIITKYPSLASRLGFYFLPIVNKNSILSEQPSLLSLVDTNSIPCRVLAKAYAKDPSIFESVPKLKKLKAEDIDELVFRNTSLYEKYSHRKLDSASLLQVMIERPDKTEEILPKLENTRGGRTYLKGKDISWKQDRPRLQKQLATFVYKHPTIYMKHKDNTFFKRYNNEYILSALFKHEELLPHINSFIEDVQDETSVFPALGALKNSMGEDEGKTQLIWNTGNNNLCYICYRLDSSVSNYFNFPTWNTIFQNNVNLGCIVDMFVDPTREDSLEACFEILDDFENFLKTHPDIVSQVNWFNVSSIPFLAAYSTLYEEGVNKDDLLARVIGLSGCKDCFSFQDTQYLQWLWFINKYPECVKDLSSELIERLVRFYPQIALMRPDLIVDIRFVTMLFNALVDASIEE